VCGGAWPPWGGTRGPPFSYFTTALRGYSTLCLSLSLFSCWSLSFCSPFSSPSARAPPRGPALSSSDSSVPLPRSLGLFLPTPIGPLSPNLRATPHPISSHFLFPCGDPRYSVPDTTAQSSSCSRSRIDPLPIMKFGYSRASATALVRTRVCPGTQFSQVNGQK